MPYYNEYTLSLTGQDSHHVKLERGQGSFSIGTRGLSQGQYDVWVEAGQKINWHAFDGLQTGAGSHWPRFIYYSGSDTGFVKWSEEREIEDFHWFPFEDSQLDLSHAKIHSLILAVKDVSIDLSLGKHITKLHLRGQIDKIHFKKCDHIPRLSFGITARQDEQSKALPDFPLLKNALNLDIANSPLDVPFDCQSLMQFKNLVSLDLSGNLTNLSALSQLKELQSLWFRNVPDLQGIPDLNTFENLVQFGAYSVDEVVGKRLRTQLRALKKEGRIKGYSTVSKLHPKIWFKIEYGIPFANWPSKTGKKATTAYKKVIKGLKKAETEEDVYELIVEFINKLNALPDMETTEREDAWTAMTLFAENSPSDLSLEKWQSWFDELRDF